MHEVCKKAKYCMMHNTPFYGLYCGYRCGNLFEEYIKRNYNQYPEDVKQILKELYIYG